jgi:hypothetical protein
MKKLGNQNIYFDFIYGRTSSLGRDKVSNKKSMYFDAMTSIINLQKRGHLYILDRNQLNLHSKSRVEKIKTKRKAHSEIFIFFCTPLLRSALLLHPFNFCFFSSQSKENR